MSLPSRRHRGCDPAALGEARGGISAVAFTPTPRASHYLQLGVANFRFSHCRRRIRPPGNVESAGGVCRARAHHQGYGGRPPGPNGSGTTAARDAQKRVLWPHARDTLLSEVEVPCRSGYPMVISLGAGNTAPAVLEWPTQR